MKMNTRIDIVITVIRNSELLYIVLVMNESSIYIGLYSEELAVSNILLTMSNWIFIVWKGIYSLCKWISDWIVEFWMLMVVALWYLVPIVNSHVKTG
jgi:hypothetical protein